MTPSETALRQHLEGAPHPGLMLNHPMAWQKQYDRWYARAKELLK